MRDSVFLRGIRLDAASAGLEGDSPVWIQIAREGQFKGYRSGSITFDRPMFEKLIANFRANPSFKAGADGLGGEPVVPYDYEHSSEMGPVGSVPQKGAPAPAWALDLQMRDGEDGQAQLWAWTKLGPEARQQIQAGEYLWTSVAIWLDAVDPVSGAMVGPTLTSIAFTNKPFIQGMQKMVASRRIAADLQVWGEAETPEELVVGMRSIFGLEDTADTTAINAELDVLDSMLEQGGELPDNVRWVVSDLGSLLGARRLASPGEIVEQARAALAGGSSPGSVKPPPMPTPAPAEEPSTEEQTTMKLTASLAQVLKVNEQDDVILAAAKQVVEKASALDELMTLFDSKDFQSLLSNAGDVIAKAEKAKGYLDALNQARSQLDQQAEAQAGAEVDAIAASMFADQAVQKKMKPLLLSRRMACRVTDPENPAALPKDDPEKLRAFREEFPVKDAGKALLTRPLFATPEGAQLGGTATGVPGSSAVGSAGSPEAVPEHLKDLGQYPGRNDVERATALLSARNPAFKQQPWARQVRSAGHFIRTGEILL